MIAVWDLAAVGRRPPTSERRSVRGLGRPIDDPEEHACEYDGLGGFCRFLDVHVAVACRILESPDRPQELVYPELLTGRHLAGGENTAARLEHVVNEVYTVELNEAPHSRAGTASSAYASLFANALPLRSVKPLDQQDSDDGPVWPDR